MPTNPTLDAVGPPTSAKNKKKNLELLGKVELCKSYRRKLTKNWSISIDYRRNKPFSSQSDSDSVAVPLDWSNTKTKGAFLFSQVPKVRVSHPPNSTTAGPWLASYENKLNDTLVISGIEAVMEECLPDCINAAGFGASLVSYEAITEDKEVPSIDLATLPPELAAEAQSTGKINGEPVPMETVPQIVDHRYVIQRISPSDFLWPLDFTGSNFDTAPWVGRSGRITWAEAVQRYKLDESERERLIGDEKTVLDTLTHDADKDHSSANDSMVGFDEVFYKEFQYDSEAKSYSTIHHLVFLNGKKDPVVDEPWKGQRQGPDGTILGVSKFPIRILTLTYITDEAIPPSDSAISRSQVDELNKSRGQVLLQRARNIPMRWADVNRFDPSVLQSLIRGTWQNIIPVQGDGTRVIGEVARSNHIAESYGFDEVAKRDVNETWSIGPNQMGSGADVETKGESGEIAASFRTRIGRERAKVAAYFVGIAEVLGGLMCLYEDPTTFGDGFDPAFSRALSFSILADATVLVDANQKLERLNKFLNDYAKSGLINLEPVLREVAILSGLDPNTTIKQPEPKPPVEPNISLRLTGAEDMMNPLLLAFMIQSGTAPKPEFIDMAKQLIQAAVIPQPPVPPGADPNAPPPPPGGDVPPMPPSGSPLPGPPPPQVGEANPQMAALDKITKRTESGENS